MGNRGAHRQVGRPAKDEGAEQHQGDPARKQNTDRKAVAHSLVGLLRLEPVHRVHAVADIGPVHDDLHHV